MRASATYRAALRMLPYTHRRAVPQLCRLLLALALVSIPLSGMPAPRASNLSPLRMTFVPFGTSFQTPSLPVVHCSIAARSGRRVVLASNTVSFPILHNGSVLADAVIDDHCRSGVAGLPSVRSPPRA